MNYSAFCYNVPTTPRKAHLIVGYKTLKLSYLFTIAFIQQFKLFSNFKYSISIKEKMKSKSKALKGQNEVNIKARTSEQHFANQEKHETNNISSDRRDSKDSVDTLSSNR